MKLAKNILAAVMAVFFFSCTTHSLPKTSVDWEMVENGDSTFLQRFVVRGDMTFGALAFNMFAREMSPVDSRDTLTEIVPGYYVISSPRFTEGADSVVVEILARGTLTSCATAPDGVHRVEKEGDTYPVAYTRHLLTQPHHWKSPGGNDPMPYGDAVYAQNERLVPMVVGPYDVVPSYKHVRLTGGYSSAPYKKRTALLHHHNPEYYTITVRGDSVTVAATTIERAQQALHSFEALVANQHVMLPNAVIADYPDFQYRGLMIDVARNFQTPAEMRRVIDCMAQYRLNRLHLHLADDEGWRIEIAPLPELTEVGARRGYTTDETKCLAQAYGGDGNPNSLGNSANGYFSRADYIDLLRYANERGVLIVPEIDVPGHSRAAIKAMEVRYRRTGDDTYRLVHDGDSSLFHSAQAYCDNVMNPALPSTYRFMETVIDEISGMHAEAGVPLVAFHIGGDEVPRGAWSGSGPAQALMAEHGMETQSQLSAYFVEQLAQMLQERGLRLSGWQEMALGHDQAHNNALASQTYSVNCWHDRKAGIRTAEMADAGYDLVLSNAEHFYLDHMYSRHPEEMGMQWGGTVDEFKTLHGAPRRLCPHGHVLGISGQLWSETLRGPEHLEMYLFPKMLGLVERAWNADSTYSDAKFNSIICQHEMPRWQAEGLNFHMRQPGIKVVDGRAMMNTPYPQAEIHYTIDGSEPTPASPRYHEPVELGSAREVRARLYYLGKESVTTILFLD